MQPLLVEERLVTEKATWDPFLQWQILFSGWYTAVCLKAIVYDEIIAAFTGKKILTMTPTFPLRV